MRTFHKRRSPEAGVSCLIHSGAQHLLVFSLELKLLDCSERGPGGSYVSRAASERWGMKGRGLTARCGRVRSAGLEIRGSTLHDVRA